MHDVMCHHHILSPRTYILSNPQLSTCDMTALLTIYTCRSPPHPTAASSASPSDSATSCGFAPASAALARRADPHAIFAGHAPGGEGLETKALRLR